MHRKHILSLSFIVFSRSEEHKFAALLMENPSQSVLLSIATSSAFNNLIRMNVNIYKQCLLCDTKFGLYNEFKHIESRAHLEKLASLINCEIQVENQRLHETETQYELWRSLKSPEIISKLREKIEKDQKDREVEDFPTDLEAANDSGENNRIISEKEQIVADFYSQIATKAWISMGANPKSFQNRVSSMRNKKFEEELIDVENKHHAYCVPCRFHIYSSKDRNDLSSFFPRHVNTFEHLGRLETYHPETQIFKGVSSRSWKCIPCQKLLSEENYQNSSINAKIKEHLRESNHKYNISLVKDAKMSVLVSLAMTPMLFAAVGESKNKKNLFCDICSKPVALWQEVEHIKTKGHLLNVENYLIAEVGEEARNLFVEVNVMNIVEKLVEMAVDT